jgi:hypothetical protein
MLSMGAYCKDALFDHAINYHLGASELVEYLQHERFFCFDPCKPDYSLKTMIHADLKRESTQLVETLLMDGRFLVGNWLDYAAKLSDVSTEMLQLLWKHHVSAQGVEADLAACSL